MVDFIENRYLEGMDIEAFNKNLIFADTFRNTVAKMINADIEEIFFSGYGSDMLKIFVITSW